MSTGQRKPFNVFIDGVPRGDLRHSGGNWRWRQLGRGEVVFDRWMDRQEAVRQIAKTCRVHPQAISIERS